ncbi:hypothetical protein DL765_002837 [Monosporascus sp. GIB2]|nr:hypothetical protein DL765_002837 [Monosporascus sp. GIB2]
MIIETIENEKSLLRFVLDNEHRKLMQEIQRHSRDHRAHFEGLKDGVDRLHIRQDTREADEKRQEILNWPTPLNYAAQQRDFYSRARPGTGQWLLGSEEYQRWVMLSNQTLFCPGIPGAGKTTLTSIIIKIYTTVSFPTPRLGIAYVYFNFNLKDEQDLQGLLSGLLKQLAQIQPSLPATLQDLHERREIERSRLPLKEIQHFSSWSPVKSKSGRAPPAAYFHRSISTRRQMWSRGNHRTGGTELHIPPKDSPRNDLLALEHRVDEDAVRHHNDVVVAARRLGNAVEPLEAIPGSRVPLLTIAFLEGVVRALVVPALPNEFQVYFVTELRSQFSGSDPTLHVCWQNS